jgi:hypothetical protein
VFSFNETVNPKGFWAHIGTFFFNLRDEDKRKFEILWEAMGRANSFLYYNLAQTSSTSFKKFDPGYYLSIYPSFKIYTSGSSKNCTAVTASAPTNLEATPSDAGSSVYSYCITATDSFGNESLGSKRIFVSSKVLGVDNATILVSWSSSDYASFYNVYRKVGANYVFLGNTASTFFTDTGAPALDLLKYPPTVKPSSPAKFYFTIPDNFHALYLKNPRTLSGAAINATLKNSRLLELPGDISTTLEQHTSSNFVEVYFDAIYYLSYHLSDIYLKAYGIDTLEFLSSNSYVPPIQGYSAETAEQKTVLKSKHYKYLFWAYDYFLNSPPTIANIKNIYGILKGIPFAYENGTVTAKSGSVLTITFDDETVVPFDIGAGTHAFNINDAVAKFSLLATDIAVEDYYSDKELIESIVDEGDFPNFHLFFYCSSIYSGYAPLINQFKKTFIPASLRIYETTVAP